MSDFLDEIRRLIGPERLRELPPEVLRNMVQGGVRQGFGLEGASIRSSNLDDQLRNADFREAALPSPKRLPPSLSSAQNISKFYGSRADIERSLAQLANNAEGYPPRVLENIRKKLMLALSQVKD